MNLVRSDYHIIHTKMIPPPCKGEAKVGVDYINTLPLRPLHSREGFGVSAFRSGKEIIFALYISIWPFTKNSGRDPHPGQNQSGGLEQFMLIQLLPPQSLDDQFPLVAKLSTFSMVS